MAGTLSMGETLFAQALRIRPEYLVRIVFSAKAILAFSFRINEGLDFYNEKKEF